MKLYNLDNADRYAQYNNYGVETLNPGNNCEMRSVEIHNKFGFDILMGMVFKKSLIGHEPGNGLCAWGYAQAYSYHLWNKVGNTIYDSEFQWNYNQEGVGIYNELPFGMNKVGLVELPKYSAKTLTNKQAQLIVSIVKTSLRTASLKGLDMVYFANFTIDGVTGQTKDSSYVKNAIEVRTNQMEKYLQENLVY